MLQKSLYIQHVLINIRHVLNNQSRPTQKSVAEASGVSRATVGAILAGGPTAELYSEETRRKVLEAADRLNYRPNLHAQIMRSGSSRLVGVVNFGTHSLLSQRKVMAVAHAISKAGMEPIVFDALWFADTGEKACKRLLELQVEGVVLVDASALFEQKYLDMLLQARVPVVTLGGDHLKGIPCILSDRQWGYHQLASHLLSVGYGDIVFLAPETGGDESPSVRAFHKAISESKRKASGRVHYVKNEFLGSDDPSDLLPYLPGKRGLSEILQSNALPEAIMCANDDWALGALAACAEADVHVPKDLAITGFENEPTSAVGLMPLTTIAHPIKEISEQAVDILLGLVNSEKRPRTKTILIRGKLIVRRSCGAYLRLKSHPQVASLR